MLKRGYAVQAATLEKELIAVDREIHRLSCRRLDRYQRLGRLSFNHDRRTRLLAELDQLQARLVELWGEKRRFLALIDAYHTAGSDHWAARPKTIDAVIEAAD
jgi:hypothetical protein